MWGTGVGQYLQSRRPGRGSADGRGRAPGKRAPQAAKALRQEEVICFQESANTCVSLEGTEDKSSGYKHARKSDRVTLWGAARVWMLGVL